MKIKGKESSCPQNEFVPGDIHSDINVVIHEYNLNSGESSQAKKRGRSAKGKGVTRL